MNLIVHENHASPSVVVRGYVRGGAVLDPPDKIGLAQLTTSMMSKGTEKRTTQEIADAMDSVGATHFVSCGRNLFRFGGKSLADDFDLLSGAIADTLICPSFPAGELEVIRGLIVSGLKRSEDDPQIMAERRFRSALYGPDHPFARPLNGTAQSVSGLSRNDILSFYKNAFDIRNCTIAVTGDIGTDDIIERADATVGRWRPVVTGYDGEFPSPRPSPHKTSTHEMAGKQRCSVIIGSLGPPGGAPDFHTAILANVILGHTGLGGRIGKRLRGSAGLAYYARSRMGAGLGPTPWAIHAGVNSADVDRAVDLIRAEIDELCCRHVSEQEIADAKSYLIGTLPLEMESNEGIATRLLDVALYERGDDYLSRYPEIINSISREAIREAAAKYLGVGCVLSIAGSYRRHEYPGMCA